MDENGQWLSRDRYRLRRHERQRRTLVGMVLALGVLFRISPQNRTLQAFVCQKEGSYV